MSRAAPQRKFCLPSAHRPFRAFPEPRRRTTESTTNDPTNALPSPLFVPILFTMKYSLAPFILRRPWLASFFKPVASWYTNAAGYRQLGLRYDDLLEEENDTAQKALKRLSAKESYERIYRIRRAVQCSYQHKLLPKEQWVTQQSDARYLQPVIDEVNAEAAEKEELDTITVIRKH
ncbi:cytochrome b-c1 complex subunit 7 [Thelonectria olida]|uniref:Complex III subunit 7 n=1 Tax=Thelonectria olida TaxID=1576542 RepID=A0A9P9ANA0_9HYPO|nr:cytochrome b-c1 complex subunit 7 [Thelonectria olida]